MVTRKKTTTRKKAVASTTAPTEPTPEVESTEPPIRTDWKAGNGRPGRPPKRPNETVAKRKKRIDDEKYFKKINSLPEHASSTAELNWIKNHPAMVRYSRMTDKERDKQPRIIITIDDVTPLHGPAPSRGAVALLQSWVNKSDEFFKMILTDQRKIASSGKPDTSLQAGGVIIDLPQEIADIDALLLSLDSAVQPE